MCTERYICHLSQSLFFIFVFHFGIKLKSPRHICLSATHIPQPFAAFVDCTTLTMHNRHQNKNKKDLTSQFPL